MAPPSPPPTHEQGERGGEEAGSVPQGAASATMKKKPIPGRKVLKRTTRRIQEDGTETVRIQYIVNNAQIDHFKETRQHHQMEAKELTRKRQRERIRELTGDDSSDEDLFLRKTKRHKPLQKTKEQSEGGQEQKQQSEDSAIHCAACGQIDHKRFEPECPLFIGDEAQSSNSSADEEDSDFEGDATPRTLKMK